MMLASEAAVTLEAFYGRDLLAGCVRDRDLAAANRAAVEEDGAGAALPFAAAELGAREEKFLAEDAEENSLSHVAAARIDYEIEWHCTSPCRIERPEAISPPRVALLRPFAPPSGSVHAEREPNGPFSFTKDSVIAR